MAAAIAARLPPEWKIDYRTARAGGDRGLDGTMRITAPDGRSAELVVELRRRVEPRDVARLSTAVREQGGGRAGLLWADFLGQRARELLQGEGISYADATGNLRVVLPSPAVFVETQGADRDPDRQPQPLRSLKGRAAGRCVRALCEFRPPYGIRDLAARSSSALGTLARVVALLEREAVVTRDEDGRVTGVKVADLIRRWSQDYDLPRSNHLTSFVAPRGLDHLQDRLRSLRGRWCLTGSLAASRVAVVAPPRLAVVFAEDVPRVAQAAGLRATDEGANVLLGEPYDPVVFDRTWERDGLVFAALPQVAVDLLTSPGRGPAEAAELLSWMETHERDWRT